MIAETMAYRLLSQDSELNSVMDKIRGGQFGNGFKQGIFTYDIPEKPTNLKNRDLAPFMRINATYDGPEVYADDKVIQKEYRIIINFWCQTAAQTDQITVLMDKILEDGGFERYTSNELPRYKDTDIDLLMNVRKYRFFEWVNITEENEELTNE